MQFGRVGGQFLLRNIPRLSGFDKLVQSLQDVACEGWTRNEFQASASLGKLSLRKSSTSPASDARHGSIEAYPVGMAY